MKKKTKIILLIVFILLVITGLYGGYITVRYFLHDDYKKILSSSSFEKAADFVAPADTQACVPGMTLAAENEKFKLYTNTKTTDVALYDKSSGQIYYSNPVDKSGPAAQELNTQFLVEYYNSARQLSKMDNYSMSVENEQFKLESIEGGIRYTYVLGDLASETGIVPTIISQERLESFLGRVPKKDADTIRKKYIKSKDQEGTMVLLESAVTRINIKRMSAILEAAGYTQEDFNKDMAETDQEEPVSFTIPIDYKLTQDGLSVSIETSKIIETGGAKLYDIQLLKYFGAAGSKEDGYILVPNGSGSLINFNNGKNSSCYTQYIYDMDPTVASYTVVENTTAAKLPVFGMKYKKSALFAIISDGDALARIDASTSGFLTDYNNVYTTFYLRDYEMLSMFGSTGSESDLPVVEDKLYKTTLKVEFVPLNGEAADYSGMANYYRNRLIKEGVLKEKLKNTEPVFYEDIIGGVDIQKDFAGIRYMDIYKMTTYDEALKIAKTLNEQGISNIRMNYLGWFNGGYYHDVADKIKGATKLGSKKDITKLQDFLSENGGGLFGNVAFNKVSYTSKRYFLSQETCGYYAGKSVILGEVNPFNLRRGSFTNYIETLYAVLSPRFLDYYTEKFSKNIKNYDMSGIALRDLGSVLASDKKRSKMINRQESKEIVKNAFKTLESTGKNLMVYDANGYSFAYTKDIVDAPIDSSKFLVVDEAIPFYEMIIHGYINYSGPELNLTQSVDRKNFLLDMIETGAAPRYVMSWENSDSIKYTGLNKMYSVQYKSWEKEAGEFYKELSVALKDVVNVPVKKHEILNENVRKITYENGISLYINRSSKDVVVDGITIPANWYSRGGK